MRLVAVTLLLVLTTTLHAQPAPVTPPLTATPELPFKLSAKAYVDATYVRNEGDGQRTTKTRGIDVKRFYTGIDYTLSELIGASFLTDIGDKNGKYDVFVKKAFVQAKLAPDFALRAGASDNPWIPLVEDVYGLRYVEQTLIDRTKFGHSADWGLHALGRVANGLIGYQLSIVNGNGYGNPARAKWPGVEARIDARLIEHLVVATGASISTLGATADKERTGNRYDGLVAWSDNRLRVGVEGFMAKNYTQGQVTGNAPANTARGLSVFASYRFVPKLGAFGRLDVVQPVADTDRDIKNTYTNIGLEYVPYTFLNLALVYKRDAVDTGAAGFTFSTGNGAIGSPMPDASGVYQEAGVFSQLKF